ncbi:uncharacterized protein LOC119996836 [Tripterygium wilfordii]|uniref:uncharacterized protein LOC119996836 n=1 Tax=Tripterygium wilfordii TaxID=458696 RepID=UPI0018F83B62|nr:uncharacterized protein LOC119996836 [Tripterygium wilfordii]
MAQEEPQSTKSQNSNTIANKNLSVDPTHPYYVHHSDHLGLMLVPTRLDGTNYPSWSKSMIHALTAKNKIGFINGTIKPPSATEQPTDYNLWNQCNSMILSWFALSVDPHLSKSVVCAKTFNKCGKITKNSFLKRMQQQYIKYKSPSLG